MPEAERSEPTSESSLSIQRATLQRFQTQLQHMEEVLISKLGELDSEAVKVLAAELSQINVHLLRMSRSKDTIFIGSFKTVNKLLQKAASCLIMAARSNRDTIFFKNLSKATEAIHEALEQFKFGS